MPVKWIDAPLFNAVALVVVVLFAVLALNSANTVAIPEGDARRFYDLEPVKATSIRRQLRSSTDMATNEHANTYGERRLVGNLEGVATKLGDKVSEITSESRRRWRLRHDSNEKYSSLKLYEAGSNLLQHEEFPKWHAFVKKHYPEEKVVGEMFDTLSRQFGNEADMVKALYGKSPPEMEGIVKALRNRQVLQWRRDDKDPKKVFDILELNKLTAKELFDSPLIDEWRIFVEAMSPGYMVEQSMFEVLSKKYKARNLFEALAVKHTTDKSSVAEKVLESQRLQWSESLKTPENLFSMLGLSELTAKELFDSPLIDVWHDFVTDSPHIKFSLNNILEFLSQKYGVSNLVEAVAVKHTADESSVAEKLLKLQLQQWYLHKTPEGVFKLLELKELPAKKLFDSPLIDVWYGYVKRHPTRVDKSTEGMLKFLNRNYNARDLFLALADKHTAGKSSVAETLLQVQLRMWLDAKLTKAEILKKLRSKEAEFFPWNVLEEYELMQQEKKPIPPISS